MNYNFFISIIMKPGGGGGVVFEITDPSVVKNVN